jgi:predicted nucleic acid-binding protein
VDGAACVKHGREGDLVKQETADELINKAVKAAIKEYSKEQKQEKRKKALHNTKMLLKNYEKIKSSIEEAISEESQLNESLRYDGEDEVYINSIRKSKLKSIIIIAHIDRALAIIQDEYKRKGTPEKYDAFISCFMEDMTYDEAAILYLSSKTSISRWINDVTKEVSIQLFGVDGVDFI